MKGIFGTALAAAACLFSETALARPTARASDRVIVNPNPNELYISKYNTINSTMHTKQMRPQSVRAPLSFALTNNHDGEQMYSYVTGRDVNDVTVMLSTNGTWYYPDAAGSSEPVTVDSAATAIPLNAFGEITEFSIPDFVSSGRLYVSEGELTFKVVADANGISTLVEPAPTNPEDPSAGLNWGFVELTNTAEAGIYANISFVDFVGLVLGMKLTLATGETQEVAGLYATSVQDICTDMDSQTAADGLPWDQMCQYAEDGVTALRVLAPNMYLADNPEAFVDYYTSYVDEAWSLYTEQDLMIDCQNDLGEVACRVEGEDLVCDGSESFPKPNEGDIFGCNSGPFENNPDTDSDLRKCVVPRLCAGFHRTTMLLEGGETQPGLPTEDYYTVDPTVHYSRIVHSYEIDGRGYTFSYDDVNPDGENAAGVVAGMDPILLEIQVGGPLE